MPCYKPQKVYQRDDGRIVWAERGSIRRSLTLPCGGCIGCRLEASRGWAVRCLHEAQMHEKNCFITLTYDEKYLPRHGSLDYGHFQRFAKRTRKALGNFRFYMSGEYGSLNGRPHYHACMFGLDFDDKEYLRLLPSGEKIYESATLKKLWPFGYSSIGNVTFESAAYVARYICKKITGDMADTHYQRIDPETGEVYYLEPEFGHMSLKPGIGATWFEKYGQSDVIPFDRCVVRGMEQNTPRYYLELQKRRDKKNGTTESDWIEYERSKKADLCREDSTEVRLRDREQVARARLRFKKRGLEY